MNVWYMSGAGNDFMVIDARGMETELDFAKMAVTLCEKTGGAFDITIAPLVDAWNIHGENPRVLTADEIAVLLPLVGSHHLRLEGNSASIDEGCSIDLGGIAKGYASDLVAQIYRDNGVSGGWASLGGNVYAHGTKPDGSFWSVAVRDPDNALGAAALLQLSDEFAVTSGGYQRYFTAEDGTVYQHILDPQTGTPAQSDLLSVTIVAQNGTVADAYSTALYVMGEEGAVTFWRANRADFDMVLITTDGRLLYTSGLSGRITTEEGGPYEVHALS